MIVHNIIEEEVFKRVKALYKQAVKDKIVWLSCDCERCQTDTACFVLNRIPPKYIVSSRGAAYAEASFDKQLVADLGTLIIEGMQRISAVKRPFHMEPQNKKSEIDGPVFNFPTFFGSVFVGNTFEPLQKGCITLYLDGKPAEMMNISWSNPNYFNEKVKGSFTFWNAPIKAATAGENRSFTFALKIETTEYAPLTTAVTVPLISEGTVNFQPNAAYSLKLQDIYLLSEEEV